MGLGSTTMLCFLLLCAWLPGLVRLEGYVGCLFSSGLCDLDENCFDDNVFGRCQLPHGSDLGFYRHVLGSESTQLLERELTRLLAGGYRWRHEYTQCVVQNILHSHKHQISYDPGLCSRLMQFTLPDVPPDIFSDLQNTNNDELAHIKFQPSRDDRTGSSIFADEVFSPAATAGAEKRSSDGERVALVHDLMQAAKNVENIFKELPNDNSADRYPPENIHVIRTDYSSDLTHRPAFSEGGTEWIPVDEPPSHSEEEIRDPFDKKRVRLTSDLVGPRPPVSNEVISVEAPNKPIESEEEKETQDSEEDLGNFRWNTKHRNPTMDDDLTKFAHRADTKVHTKIPLNEDAGSNDLNDVIENDYLEDSLYAILPMDKTLSTFTRNMRYDTKKPGPNFNIHEDEDGDSSQYDDIDVQSTDNLFMQLSKNAWEKNLLSLLDTPALGQKSATSSFMPRWEVTDETRRILVSAGRSEPTSHEKEVETAAAAGNPPSLQLERISAAHPELLEGVEEAPDAKPEERTANAAKTGEGHIGHYDSVDATHAYLLIKEKNPSKDKAIYLVETLGKLLGLPKGSFSNTRLEGRQITFKVNPNTLNYNASDIAMKAEELSPQLKQVTDLTVEGAGIGDKVKYEVIPSYDYRLIVVALASCGAVAAMLLVAVAVYLTRRYSHGREKFTDITRADAEASQDYQDLCRQRMASKSNDKPEPAHAVNSPKKTRSLSQEGQASSSGHSSTSSWNEEPVISNMDISTGHMILAYMEDHLKNKDRLEREWEALCAYEAELCSVSSASQPPNIKKNRYTDVLPYDHSRVILNELSNVSNSDYINASSITDHDPRNPAYIATQGPLPQTAADFWQMIWEQGSVVVVMLSRLMENGIAMCHRYWPEEGSEVYHIYEVHLVSEHIWCDDYLVRSFYLKNLRTNETRTVTQFHFMSWPDNGVPNSTRALLEFRRKVNKSYRGRSCPIVVHCSDGIGRTGTYCLIDMVLNRMAKGAKEIDIAATLEHVRDQRSGMVKTKAQFEFVLMAVAEEVHAILKSLSQ